MKRRRDKQREIKSEKIRERDKERDKERKKEKKKERYYVNPSRIQKILYTCHQTKQTQQMCVLFL